MVWLGVAARSFYQKQLSGFLDENIRWAPALSLYFLFTAGIIVFGVFPALEKGSLAQAALYGALFGFFCYATYDLTNQATLKDWPLAVTVVDVAWGTFVSSLVSVASYLIAGLLV